MSICKGLATSNLFFSFFKTLDLIEINFERGTEIIHSRLLISVWDTEKKKTTERIGIPLAELWARINCKLGEFIG